jgi:hypothetical protein
MSERPILKEPSFAPAVPTEPPASGPRTWKIRHAHLERLAIVYVRQSTPHQVAECRESRVRQYALADYAAAQGWARDRILVIDEDQGHSGQSATGRPGFQRLLTEVTLDHVGMVLGLEMSRLARSNKDWHHLLELCALFGTLLADQEGIYEPREPNDRLVLGLKARCPNWRSIPCATGWRRGGSTKHSAANSSWNRRSVTSRR